MKTMTVDQASEIADNRVLLHDRMRFGDGLPIPCWSSAVAERSALIDGWRSLVERSGLVTRGKVTPRWRRMFVPKEGLLGHVFM
jgi:hypothetical protein